SISPSSRLSPSAGFRRRSLIAAIIPLRRSSATLPSVGSGPVSSTSYVGGGATAERSTKRKLSGTNSTAMSSPRDVDVETRLGRYVITALVVERLDLHPTSLSPASVTYVITTSAWK